MTQHPAGQRQAGWHHQFTLIQRHREAFSILGASTSTVQNLTKPRQVRPGEKLGDKPHCTLRPPVHFLEWWGLSLPAVSEAAVINDHVPERSREHRLPRELSLCLLTIRRHQGSQLSHGPGRTKVWEGKRPQLVLSQLLDPSVLAAPPPPPLMQTTSLWDCLWHQLEPSSVGHRLSIWNNLRV